LIVASLSSFCSWAVGSSRRCSASVDMVASGGVVVVWSGLV
jgi:hypothetical protein